MCRAIKMIKETSMIYLACLAAYASKGQELEPRVYAALPKNLDVAAIVYAFSHGNVLADPSLPVSNFKINAHTIGAGYVHTFAVASKLARIQVIMPYTFLSGRLQINGRDTSGARNGFGDMRLRLGINLTGSPPLAKREFVQYTQETIIGVSLVSSIPVGLYYTDKRINLGSHRWAFKPELGISQRFKRVYAELYSGVWFYTDNKKYLVSKTLQQKPLFSVQAHISYYFKNQMWVSFNGNWFNGGETSIDGVSAGDLLDNWRVGATWAFPIGKGQSLKLQLHVGAFTATGYDYNLASLSYQYIF